MKIKWFLRGLGVGMIVTAILLCTNYRKESDHSELIKEAKKIGMVFPKEETSPAEQILPEITPAAVSESAVSTTQKENAKKKAEKEKVENSSKDITSVSAYHKNKQSFVVREGFLSSSVARELEEQGLVKDADEFDTYLEKNGYAKYVRSGKYDIPKDADYKTIAKIITKQN